MSLKLEARICPIDPNHIRLYYNGTFVANGMCMEYDNIIHLRDQLNDQIDRIENLRNKTNNEIGISIKPCPICDDKYTVWVGDHEKTNECLSQEVLKNWLRL